APEQKDAGHLGQYVAYGLRIVPQNGIAIEDEAGPERQQRPGPDPGKHRNQAPGVLLGLEKQRGVVGGVAGQRIGTGGIHNLRADESRPRGEEQARREESELHTRASRNSLKSRTPMAVGP